MANILRKSWLISRRTALKGVGASLMLPLLDQMGWAEVPRSAARPPTRLAYLYVPYGVIRQQQAWNPATVGALGPTTVLPTTLAPLRSVLDAVTVISGLDNKLGDGEGHGTEVCTFLTNVPVVKGAVRVGQSVDQYAASVIGGQTILPSLQLCIQDGFVDGKNKDYPGPYHDQLSWHGPTTPADKEVRPRAVLERLFALRPNKTQRSHSAEASVSTSNPARTDAPTSTRSLNQSMLDLILADQKRLQNQLGYGDRQKIDEYLESLHGLEQRIGKLERAQAEAELDHGKGTASSKGYETSPLIDVAIPAGSQETLDPNFIYSRNLLPFSTRARVMLDLLTLAFQSNTTRVSTLLFSYPYGHNYPELGFSDNHHALSHHENNPEKMEKFLKIAVLQAEQLGYFLQRLRSLKEGDGSLLDNCMVVYGSGMGDGNAHDNNDLPILLCGGTGFIRGGRHLSAPKQRLASLHLALLSRLGVKADSWGDSSQPLDLR